jgi:subfamily B ATP-binding cassette protein MsbA
MSDRSKPVAARFWGYVRRYKGLLGVSAVGNLITVSIATLAPLFMKLVIDEAIPGRNVPFLAGIVLTFLILEGLRYLVGYGHNYLLYYAGQRVVFDIRRALFHHLQMLHLSFYETQRTASLVNRVVHDATAVQQFITTALTTISNSLVSLALAMTIMFFLNWKMALFCTASLPVYFAVIHLYRRGLHTRSHDVQERQSALAGTLGETFTGIKVVKCFAQEDHERRRFIQRIRENFPHELELSLLGTRMWLFLAGIFAVVYGSVLLWGGSNVMYGTMSLGSFVAFTSYLMMLFGPLQNLSSLIQISTSARTGIERILSLHDIRPNITEIPNPIELPALRGAVDFDHVNFSYDRGVAVNDFTLSVPAGEIIALVGPSGSGKSTLISLLTRFYDPSAGTIRIDGHDLRTLDYGIYRQQIGIVLQDNFLFSGSIDENIRYGRPDATEDEVRRAAELANAWEFIAKMEGGLKAQVGQGGATLSGGQRQRIAIARCLLKDPRILIFDEATSALDNESEALVQQSLDTLMQGRTVFIVAHRLSTIRRANRIAVMESGRLAQLGTHQELIAVEGPYRNLQKLSVVAAQAAA